MKQWVRWAMSVGVGMVLLGHGMVQGQIPCEVVNTIRPPVDPQEFVIVQDYGVNSPRHQGRLHTGEDWYGGRGTSLGQPIYAIASGRVTYSSATGWGRDGGVVILEHTFPDASVAYSQYGHMAESADQLFPAVFTCVQAGDPIGLIGDVRPAPHVHLEIKTNNPTTPGAGYSRLPLAESGWVNPTQFITNWQMWLTRPTEWHVERTESEGPVLPPVYLEDNSTLLTDGARVLRITADGRAIWRTPLDQRALGILPDAGGGLIVYPDGTTQTVNQDGALGTVGSLGVVPAGLPLLTGSTLLIPLAGNQLAALDPATRSVRWLAENVPAIVRAYDTGMLTALITQDGEIWILDASGAVLNRAALRDLGSLATGPGGSLIVYTRGGLWRVGTDGVWAPLLDGAPGANRAGAALVAPSGTAYLFDGETLRAYSQNALTWEIPLAGISGESRLTLINNTVLLMTSSGGDLVAVQPTTGGLCSTGQIYGDARTQLWATLGSDNLLRIAAGDQLLALDWTEFLGACG